MSNFTQGVLGGTAAVSKQEMAVGINGRQGEVPAFFQVLKEIALATPLAIVINALRGRG